MTVTPQIHDRSHNTQIHDRSLSWLGTGTSIKVAGLNKFDEPKPALFVKWCGHASALHM